ncbi:N-formylglutamate amidohydrolase [Halocynthiibacter namhaensis]|uniref:N-formylglutamate amidohydrolase n=1 Tax=Halocynthiibacter namhaensis TaxID=1290553 RepID=UPI000A8914E8
MQINDIDFSMSDLPFHITRPRSQSTAVIFASPHSGRAYTNSFLQSSVLDQLRLRSSEDAFVDVLFEDAPEFGAPLLCANTPRAYVDLNRAVDELDGALIHNVPKTRSNPRVASGLGVIPRVVANGRAIYHGKMQLITAEQRLRDHWYPYHNALASLMGDTLHKFGQAMLIDCHSMPHEALDSVAGNDNKRPDIVIGDRFGSTCSGQITKHVAEGFRNAGFAVAHNVPFAGAYITQQYGRPSQGQHALQIEINRSLYMNEAHITPNANFHEFKAILNNVISDIADIARDPRALLAAE